MLPMLMIRLKRVGRKHDPSYRVVVTDNRKGPKSGKYVENLGFYDPRRNIREVKGDRVKYWISVGAQVSDTVHNILITEKIIEGNKKNVLPKKSPIIKKEKLIEKEKAPEVKGEIEKEVKEEKKIVEEIPAEEPKEEEK